MNMPADLLRDLLVQTQNLREVEDGIWSVLPPGAIAPAYDGRVRLYDRLIGNRIYNRVAWGSSPKAYATFAAAAAESGTDFLLDAGCGTLVSTARVHARSGRPTVLLDLSIDMLRAGRERVCAQFGKVPDHLIFLQADIQDLPFKRGVFGSVLCPGMLHIFDEIERITAGLSYVAQPGSRIFLSSLVSDRPISRRYLQMLHRAGEVASPRRYSDLLSSLKESVPGLMIEEQSHLEGGMAFIIAKQAPA